MKLFTVLYSHKYGVDVLNFKKHKEALEWMKQLEDDNDFNVDEDLLELLQNDLIE